MARRVNTPHMAAVVAVVLRRVHGLRGVHGLRCAVVTVVMAPGWWGDGAHAPHGARVLVDVDVHIRRVVAAVVGRHALVRRQQTGGGAVLRVHEADLVELGPDGDKRPGRAAAVTVVDMDLRAGECARNILRSLWACRHIIEPRTQLAELCSATLT